MKIKLFIIGCTLLVMSGGAFAQKSVLNSAKADYDKFSGLKNPNTMSLALPSLNSAKPAIDKAEAKTTEVKTKAEKKADATVETTKMKAKKRNERHNFF